jgi:hypothetical protein
MELFTSALAAELQWFTTTLEESVFVPNIPEFTQFKTKSNNIVELELNAQMYLTANNIPSENCQSLVLVSLQSLGLTKNRLFGSKACLRVEELFKKILTLKKTESNNAHFLWATIEQLRKLLTRVNVPDLENTILITKVSYSPTFEKAYSFLKQTDFANLQKKEKDKVSERVRLNLIAALNTYKILKFVKKNPSLLTGTNVKEILDTNLLETISAITSEEKLSAMAKIRNLKQQLNAKDLELRDVRDKNLILETQLANVKPQVEVQIIGSDELKQEVLEIKQLCVKLQKEKEEQANLRILAYDEVEHLVNKTKSQIRQITELSTTITNLSAQILTDKHNISNLTHKYDLLIKEQEANKNSLILDGKMEFIRYKQFYDKINATASDFKNQMNYLLECLKQDPKIIKFISETTRSFVYKRDEESSANDENQERKMSVDNLWLKEKESQELEAEVIVKVYKFLVEFKDKDLKNLSNGVAENVELRAENLRQHETILKLSNEISLEPLMLRFRNLTHDFTSSFIETTKQSLNSYKQILSSEIKDKKENLKTRNASSSSNKNVTQQVSIALKQNNQIVPERVILNNEIKVVNSQNWLENELQVGMVLPTTTQGVFNIVSEYFNPSKKLGYNEKMTQYEWEQQSLYNSLGNTTKLSYNVNYPNKFRK